MKTLIIRRIATGSNGTYGVMTFDDIPFALTLEREWLDNRSNVSCIPAGVYNVLRCNQSPSYGYKDSSRFGDTFHVQNVPDRTKILFHKGNLDDDSHGCILIGEQFERVNGSPGVAASKKGFNEFLDLLEDEDEFRVILVDDWKNSIT